MVTSSSMLSAHGGPYPRCGCAPRAPKHFGGRGLAFYDFPMRPRPYKDDYRARLDALRPDADDTDRIVGEVKITFGLNHALLDELAA